MPDPSVLIVGAGPSGLAAAAELARLGVRDVLVIDRDDAPGGLPRFCAHPGFGLGYLAIPRSGPGFARRLAGALEGSSVRVACRTTLVELGEGPSATVTGPESGYRRLKPRAVILATGIREANRGNRLVPGDRPSSGILTTGLLQQMVARQVAWPDGMRSLVVVGTEHVSFSAIWTARHAGLKVCLMVDERSSIASFRPAAWLARAAGVEIRLRTRIAAIRARGDHVSGVTIERDGRREEVACDGVVFTAGWKPETEAVARSVQVDPVTGGISADEAGRTSLTGVFAAGNLRHPLKASGACARQGCRVARTVGAYLVSPRAAG